MSRFAMPWTWTVQAFRSVRIVRGPLLAALFVGAVLAVPDQMHDLYRADLDDALAGAPLRPVLALSSIIACGVVMWLLARHLVRSVGLDTALGSVRPLLAALPSVCGAITPAALAFGLYRSARQHGGSGLTGSVDKGSAALATEIATRISASTALLQTMSVLLIGATIIIAAAGIWQARRSDASGRRSHPTFFGPLTCAAAVALTLALVAVFAFGPVELPEAMGTIIVIAVFGMLMAYFLSLLLHVADRYAVPALTLLLGAGVLFSYLDINDNHHVELVAAAQPRAPVAPDVDPYDTGNAFRAWYNARGDRAAYEARGLPYPVFIVTAAGGGLYAADQSATFLARMQDRCPTFAQHVFAVSGVSGGSLGSAVFSTLAKQPQLVQNGPARPCAKGDSAHGPLERKVDRFFSHNLLAPVVAATLFPDFLQRFLPFPVARFDRAKALEASFKAVSQRELEDGRPGTEAGPFARPFLDHWSPKGAAPALFLNGTQINNGHRVLIAPFWDRRMVANDSVNKTTWLQGLFEMKSDVTLATGVGLSARFPLMLPPGRIFAPDSGLIRVMDGAMFENSGIETAMDLIEQLDGLRAIHQRALHDSKAAVQALGAAKAKELEGELLGQPFPNVKFYVLVISSKDVEDPKDSPFLSETMATLQSMFSTRGARADFGIRRARARLCAQQGGCLEGSAARSREDLDPLQEVDFYAQDFQLPLGWRLSKTSQLTIDLIVGRSNECTVGRDIKDAVAAPAANGAAKSQKEIERDGRVAGVVGANGCTAAWIEHHLTKATSR